MKIRNGFVSNSSSSSFVVIDLESTELMTINCPKKNYTISIPQTFGGTCEFGRDHIDHKDFGSRLNWAFLMAYSMDSFQAKYGDIIQENDSTFDDEYWKNHSLKDFHNLVTKIKSVLYEKFYKDHSISYRIQVNFNMEEYFDGDWESWWNNDEEILEKEYMIGSIDHQSMWFQSPENLEIFESNDNLKRFLFAPASEICERGD